MLWRRCGEPGSSPPVISLDQRNSSPRSSWGTPSRPAMACSGSSHDTCSTKSPNPRPRRPSRCSARAAAVRPAAADRPRGETARDDLAQPGVVRSVHVEHDEALEVDVLALHVVRPARDRAVLAAGEDVAAQRHLLDVLVLGHHPVAAVVEAALADRLLVPPDRRGLAQLGEFVDGQTLDVDGRVGGSRSRPEDWGRHMCAPQLQRVLVPLKHAFTAD